MCWNGLYVIGHTEHSATYRMEIDSIEVDDAEEFAEYIEREEISALDSWEESSLWVRFHDEILPVFYEYGTNISG